MIGRKLDIGRQTVPVETTAAVSPSEGRNTCPSYGDSCGMEFTQRRWLYASLLASENNLQKLRHDGEQSWSYPNTDYSYQRRGAGYVPRKQKVTILCETALFLLRIYGEGFGFSQDLQEPVCTTLRTASESYA
jgi:hypothetical protein